MALPHAAHGQKFDIPRLGAAPADARSHTLFKTAELEVIRLVVHKDKELPPHSVPRPITVQCLEGSVAFTALGQTQELEAGQILYLEGGETHALRGITDAAVLLTILL